jgi:ABC-type transport system involved in cytochrome c biogenesis permease subunit
MNNNLARFAPGIVVGLGALYLMAMMVPPAAPEGGMRLDEFGQLPILENGRVKPLDTVARNSLMIVSGKQTFKDEKGQAQPAVKWLLDVMTSGPVFKYANQEKGAHYPIAGETHKVFRIDNDQVLAMLGLQPREGFRYAIAEFAGRLDKLEAEAEKAQKRDPKRLDAYEAKVIEVYKHIQVYLSLAHWPQTLYAVPPLAPGEDWQRFQELRQSGQGNAAAGAFAAIMMAYANNDAKAFNEELDSYRTQLDKPLADQVRMTGLEAFFNHFEPFYQCTVLYLFVFVLACVSWLGWTEPLNRAAFWLAVLTLVIHTLALLARMYLMNRWFVFVTNLYSSAVFIGWAGVILCLGLEQVFRNGVGTVVAAFCGATTMLIAHYLGASGDTLEMLQAVLDTNFWLATHVTCVTLGYAATLVAGVIGAVYILRGVLSPTLTKVASKTLGQMLYAVVCFAMLFSFTGTVLGGIWADQSWGRFWGWDPKENGAVLIVIWNALLLHARWGGMVKERGMALLAVFGNMVTGWSWFGTNQLGVGLHAYGFSNALALGLVIGWAKHLAVLILGALPLRWWASYETLLRVEPPRPVPAAASAPAPGGKRAGKRGRRRGDPGIIPRPA